MRPAYGLDRPLWYGLDEQPTTIAEADKLFADPRRHIATTALGPYRVSTVFLVIDASLGLGAEPVLYETMIFGPEEDELSFSQWRYTTRAMAEAGHAGAVDLVHHRLITQPLPPPDDSAAPTA